MPINSSIAIFNSVGLGGDNVKFEVETVQQRLNELMSAPRVPLDIDGATGSKTIKMIRDFQKSVCKFKNPDGRVDITGKTILALNDPASEGIWAKMSIPPAKDPVQQSVDKKTGEIDEENPYPSTPKQAVKVAVGRIAAEQVMTNQQKVILERLLFDLFKAQSGGFTVIGPGGMTKQQFDEWIDTAKKVFNVTRAALTILGPEVLPVALVAFNGVLSMALPFVMFAGFVGLLSKAMSSDERIYKAISIAYTMVHWAEDTAVKVRPQSCKIFLTRMQNNTNFTEYDRRELRRAWSEGQTAVMLGTHKTVSRIAGSTPHSYYEVDKILRKILGAADQTRLARFILRGLADKFEKKGDWNVANSIRLHAEERVYGD